MIMEENTMSFFKENIQDVEIQNVIHSPYIKTVSYKNIDSFKHMNKEWQNE